MKLKLQVFGVDIFRGHILEQTQTVQYEGTLFVQDINVTVPVNALSLAQDTLPVRVCLSLELATLGYSIEPDAIKVMVAGQSLSFVGEPLATSEKAMYLYFCAHQEVGETAPTVITPESPTQSTPTTDEGVARIYRKWRGSLNKLITSRDSLKAKQESGQTLTVEESIKYQQTLGAVNTLSGVLADLQQLRPVNESVLNI